MRSGRGGKETSGGINPIVPIDRALHPHEPIDEGVDRRFEVGGAGDDRIAVMDELLKESVSGGKALAQERCGDRVGLVQVVEVARDAEQVARIGAGGQRAAFALASEDGDGVDWLDLSSDLCECTR